MMRKRFLMACGLLAMAAAPVLAKGWEVPSYTVNMLFSTTDDVFPGSANTGPDQILEPSVEFSSSNRLGKNSKLGLSASLGGTVQQEFTRANYGWLGAGANLRNKKLTYTLDGEYTPSRNKFPSDPEEGGEYRGWEFTGGLRRPVNDRTRLRLEATFDWEDFKNPLIKALGRDAQGSEYLGQVNFAPVRELDLRALGTIAHDETESRKYRKDLHTFGLGAAWSDSLWRFDLSSESGVRRYPDAISGDSNFERRDQWIELVLRVTRRFSPGLAVSLAGELTDQTSSRDDKNFNVHKFTLGVEWTGGGD